MYDILVYPDKGLRRHGIKVEQMDDRIKEIIKNMFATHYAQESCAGLAATQLAIDNAPMISVIDFSETKDKPLCLINPEIVASQGSATGSEGCMSIYPGDLSAEVTRSEEITVVYMDEQGEQQQLQVDGFMAKCIQHEVDHLHGKLYIDHLKPIKRQMIEKKIQKLASHQIKEQDV